MLIPSFETIKVAFAQPCILFFRILAAISEAAAVIPSSDKTFFAEGTVIFLNGPANLPNNDPKNPQD